MKRYLIFSLLVACCLSGVFLFARSVTDYAMENNRTVSAETNTTTDIPVVYMIISISSKGLMAVYEALGRKPAEGQKVAVKISTGQSRESNQLDSPDFVS